MQQCLLTFAIADQMAIKLQSSLDRYLKWVIYFIVAAVCCFSAFAHLGKEFNQNSTVILYLATLIFADCLYLCLFRTCGLAVPSP